LNAGYQVARPGDTVQVAAGAYPSQRIAAKPSAARPNVVIRPALGARVVIGNAGATNDCLGFSGAAYVEVRGIETVYTTASNGLQHQCGIAVGRGGAHHVTLDGVDSGPVWIAAHDVTVRNSDLGPSVSGHGNGIASSATALWTVSTSTNEYSKRAVFEGNTFHDGGRVGSAHPQCTAPWYGQDFVFRNNRFNNCHVFHFWMPAQSSTQANGPALIEGNTFTQTNTARFGCSSQQIKFGDHGGEIRGAVFRSNRVLTSCIGLYPALGTNGGEGDVTIMDNQLGRSLSIQGRSCMGEKFTVQQGGATYTCGGNSLGLIPAPTPTPTPEPTPVPNREPSACFTRTPSTSTVGESITFDAACSTDPDGDALTYSWDIAPGADGIYERVGQTMSYAYQGTGTKTARLRVDDGHGHVVDAAQTFIVR
jgi:PKD domain